MSRRRTNGILFKTEAIISIHLFNTGLKVYTYVYVKGTHRLQSNVVLFQTAAKQNKQ